MRSLLGRARAAALVAALTIALLPAGGLTICFGHDGHVSVAAGPEQGVAEQCPCDSAAAAPTPTHVPAAPETTDDGDAHPPCDDLPLGGTAGVPVARGAIEDEGGRTGAELAASGDVPAAADAAVHALPLDPRTASARTRDAAHPRAGSPSAPLRLRL